MERKLKDNLKKRKSKTIEIKKKYLIERKKD